MQQCRELVRGLVFYHLLFCFGTARTHKQTHTHTHTRILGGYNGYIQTCAELCLGEFVTAAIPNNNDDTSKERHQHYCS